MRIFMYFNTGTWFWVKKEDINCDKKLIANTSENLLSD